MKLHLFIFTILLSRSVESTGSWTDHGQNTCYCGGNIVSWTRQSVASCKARCEGHDRCRSIEWTSDGRCNGHATTTVQRGGTCCNGWRYFTLAVQETTSTTTTTLAPSPVPTTPPTTTTTPARTISWTD